MLNETNCYQVILLAATFSWYNDTEFIYIDWYNDFKTQGSTEFITLVAPPYLVAPSLYLAATAQGF